ncbi:MAG: hypothetical protein CL387_03715, partial [Acidiferrobacter sp.]|nr:hypothetical protein [Acidiferrobacter sp.]
HQQQTYEGLAPTGICMWTEKVGHVGGHSYARINADIANSRVIALVSIKIHRNMSKPASDFGNDVFFSWNVRQQGYAEV